MRAPYLASLLAALACLAPALAHARVVPVDSVDALREAVGAAEPGDVITLEPGTYRLDRKISITRAGTASAPITITAQSRHGALIEVDAIEGINLSAPHWQFEQLHFKGVCARDSDCEHALHLAGDADFVVVRDNLLEDFNAQIKANGVPDGSGGFLMPDDGVIEGNEFFDNAPRDTSNPVSKINLNGGSRWQVRANFIHDFAKAGATGNGISYAAFMKGKSSGGVFERNLVVCELNHSGQVRLGLSFGGGGTGDQFCPGDSCTPEHDGGIMRNNIIARCPADVAIYLNESANTLIEHNTIYDTTGVDVRFEASSATFRHNLLSGQIRSRQGGTITLEENNLKSLSEADFAAIFADPDALDFTLLDGAMILDQAASSTIEDDFCGQRRDGARDIGAVEYLSATPCDTSTLPPLDSMMPPEQDMGGGAGDDMDQGRPRDMGSSQNDQGSALPDLATSADQGNGASDQGEGGGSPQPDASLDMGALDNEANGSSGDDAGCSCTSSSAPRRPAGALLALLALLAARCRKTRRVVLTPRSGSPNGAGAWWRAAGSIGVAR